MDIGNLLNLLFFGFAMNGVSHIFEGKTTEKKGEAVKGIIQFCVSVLGIAFASPICQNMWISLAVACIFSFLSIAYMASVFVNAKPSEEVWKVNAQLLPPNEELPAGEPRATKEAQQTRIPVAWNNVKSMVRYVKDK